MMKTKLLSIDSPLYKKRLVREINQHLRNKTIVYLRYNYFVVEASSVKYNNECNIIMCTHRDGIINDGNTFYSDNNFIHEIVASREA